MNKSINIAVNFILCLAGFMLTQNWLNPFGFIFDGGCSGMTGSYPLDCSIKEVIYIFILITVSFLLFKNKILTSKVIIASYVLLTLVSSINNNFAEFHMPYLQYTGYIPSLYGIWVGFYCIALLLVLNIILMRHVPKYVRIGL